MKPATLILSLVSMAVLMAAMPGCGHNCAFHGPPDHYRFQVEQWQLQLEQEGWSDALVEDVVEGCRESMSYVPKYLASALVDAPALWLTPAGIERAGFHGDCVDTAVLMWHTLRRLRYPHEVRIRIVRSAPVNHAVLRVEAERGWREFNTTDATYTTPICEFDEREFWELCATESTP